MTLKIRNLDYLRTADPATAGKEYGARLYEALDDFNTAISNHLTQTNGDPAGEPQPPPPLAAINVTSTSVGHHISLTHPGNFYRGVEYHAEYSSSPAFTNPFPVHMGPAREFDAATGNQSLYWRAFAQYPTGQRTAPVYLGGNQPRPVIGGNNVAPGPSQGSGTGQPGEGLSGFGPVQFRSSTGKAPVR